MRGSTGGLQNRSAGSERGTPIKKGCGFFYGQTVIGAVSSERKEVCFPETGRTTIYYG